MHEIEVKARIGSIDHLRLALQEKGIEFGESTVQHDTIYIQGEWETVQNDPERVILRIRRTKGKAVLTLKKNVLNDLHSIEHETEVALPDEADEILLLTGWQPFIEVKKSRQKAQFNDWEICLDSVEGLGEYIEVERLVEEGAGAETIQAELFSFLQTLGVRKEDQETRGYDTLIRLKKEASRLL